MSHECDKRVVRSERSSERRSVPRSAESPAEGAAVTRLAMPSPVVCELQNLRLAQLGRLCGWPPTGGLPRAQRRSVLVRLHRSCDQGCGREARALSRSCPRCPPRAGAQPGQCTGSAALAQSAGETSLRVDLPVLQKLARAGAGLPRLQLHAHTSRAAAPACDTVCRFQRSWRLFCWQKPG